MSEGPVTVVIRYTALPGKGPAALAAVTALVAQVLAKEADCLAIEILVDPADDTCLALHERWTSREAYTGPHMETEHIQAFIRDAGTLYAGPPAITFWRPVTVA
jgi:quinol monooxygenase YgiN